MSSGWADLAAVVGRKPATAAEATETFANTAAEVEAVNIPPEVFGLASYSSPTAPAPRVSRREAIQVAAVKKCRDLVAGAVGGLPLVTIKPDLSVDTASWLEDPERDVARSVTLSRTAEDLLFEGIAWWRIVAFDWRGFPAEVVRLEPRSVDVLADGQVEVTGDGHRGLNWRWPKDSELIRFDSPNDPLLVAGARAIRQCLILDTAAQRYADGAPPLDWFSPAEGADPAGDTEIQAALDAWYLARKNRATGYVPAALKYNSEGWDAQKLELAEQRQHAVLEIARAAGVDAEELGVAVTSRTYANMFDRRKAFLDFTLGPYLKAIEDRLSKADVTPRGTRVRFDLDDFLRSDPLARWTAAKVGLEVGAVTRPEIRAGERKPALTEDQERAAAPAPVQAVPVQQITPPTPIREEQSA